MKQRKGELDKIKKKKKSKRFENFNSFESDKKIPTVCSRNVFEIISDSR